LGGPIGNDYDILVARSADNGVTWTPPRALNATARGDSGVDSWPHVATDGAGHWIAVWHSTENLGGVIETDYDLFVARSTDNGETWTYPDVLNTNAATDGFSDYYPQVATDGAGLWLVAWESYDSLGGTIGLDEDILVTRSTDNGATWTYPEPLNTNAATDDQWADYDYSPRVTTDGAGHWVAAWYSTNDVGGTPSDADWDLLAARSADNGATWTDPQHLNTNATTDSGHDRDPQVMTDRAGHWVAVWRSDDDLRGTIDTDEDILVARSTDNGATWTYPEPLNTNAATDSGEDNQPHVTSDGAGHWVAVWQSNDDLGGPISTDYDVLVARSPDNGVTWTAPAPLNTNADTDSGDDMVPRVTPNGFGRWVAVWMTADDLGGTIGPDFDILTARWTLCCLFLQNTGPTMIHYCPAPFGIAAGLLSELGSGGDFSQATCLGSFTESPIADPLGNPPIGDGWYYLARGVDSCPSYGDSSLDPDPRDDLDLNDPCP
jgi:Neuraminidase (sialidase)